MNRRAAWLRALLVAAAVAAATVVVFRPSLQGDFVWDDHGLLGAENEAVDTWADVIEGFGKAVTAGAGVAYYRPILMATFVADFQVAGPNPVRFHRTNVWLHAVNAALVVILLFVLTGHLGAAAVGALLFAVHPIQGQAVGLIMGRNDELLVPPLVAIMLADDWAERRGRRVFGGIIIAIGYAVALWVKETAVVVPLLILLTDWLWRGRSLRELRGRLPLLAALAVITGFYFWTRIVVIGAILDTGQYGSLGPFGRLALAIATLGYYFRLLVVPRGFAPAPYHPGLVDPGGAPFWIAALFVAAYTLLVVVSLRRAPRVAYGLLFFVVAALPVLGLGALMKLPMLEHRAYLPMLGIACAATLLTPRVGASLAGRTAIAALLVGLAALTTRRLPVYQTSLELWGMGVTNAPLSDYPRNNYGAALMEANRVPEAIVQLEEGLRLNPDYDRARYNLAACLESIGRRGDAIVEMEKLAAIRPTDWPVFNRLGLMRAKAGDLVKSREAFEHAIGLKPDEPILLRNLHDVLTKLGAYPEAVERARHLTEVEPAKPESWARLGGALRRARQPAEAVTAYERVLALGQDSAFVQLELAAALWDSGRPAAAVPHAERARALGAGDDAPIIQLLRESGMLDVPLSLRLSHRTAHQA